MPLLAWGLVDVAGAAARKLLQLVTALLRL